MPSLGAWRAILSYDNDHLLSRLANSVFVASVSTVLTILFGGMAVYGLTRFQSRLRWNRLLCSGMAAMLLTSAFYVPALEWQLAFALTGTLLVLVVTRLPDHGPLIANDQIRFGILATRIVPPVVVILPLYMMAQRIGALDTHFALIAAYSAANLPVAVWLMMPVFGLAATEQEEAAQLEGASHVRIVFTIFMPMVAGSIAAIGLVIFVLCWNEYLFAAALTNDSVSTLPAWVIGQMSIKEAQVGGEGDEWPQLSAAILFMALPLVFFTVFVQRILGRTAARVS
jgi:multiple sugar transport system permease protein